MFLDENVIANNDFLLGLLMMIIWIMLSLLCCLVQFKLTAAGLEDGGNICPFDLSSRKCPCFTRNQSMKDRGTTYFYLDGEKWRESSK